MSENWNVSFNDGFFENYSKKRGGKEEKIDLIFKWGEHKVHIPSIYICSKGLVADILIEVDKEKIWSYINKFNLIKDEFAENLSKDQRDELERENPLNHRYNTAIKVNKKLIRQFRGCGCSWIPELPEDKHPSKEAKETLEYYDKPLDKAWSIHRFNYEWVTVRKPKITSLEITLSQNKQNFPSEHFKNPQIGDKFEITNPINGQKHQLNVVSLEKRTLDNLYNVVSGLEIPNNFTVMHYTVKPDIGIGNFNVEDIIEADIPRKINNHKENSDFNSTKATSIGIIGGIDGPVTISYASIPPYRTATSSMHFDTEYDIEWRAVFREKQLEDITITIV